MSNRAAGKPTLVEDIMSKKLVSAKADSSAREVAQLMAEKGVSSVILKDGGKIVGIITERDLARNGIRTAVEANDNCFGSQCEIDVRFCNRAYSTMNDVDLHLVSGKLLQRMRQGLVRTLYVGLDNK